MGDWDDDFELFVFVVIEVGEVVMGYFCNLLEIWWKNEGCLFVMVVDYVVNDILIDWLCFVWLFYGWLLEEIEDDGVWFGYEMFFVIDLIDGICVFMNGFVIWCVSVVVVY